MIRTLAGLTAVFLGSAAHAATVQHVLDTDRVLTVEEVTQNATMATDMLGMTATATFADGSSETAIWSDLGGGLAGVIGGGFALSTIGNTFVSSWELLNNYGLALTQLVLNGAPGKTTFDVAYDPYPGTENSAQGAYFALNSDMTGDILATYSDAVAIGSDEPVGDLFATLTVDLTDLSGGGLASDESLLFRQDTDNTATLPVPTTVPLPGGLPLMAGALIGAALVLRRRSST